MSPRTCACPDNSLSNFVREIQNEPRDTSRTHSFHPYPAKFIPAIPRRIIRLYGAPGPILDPMCGSGTTLVEAVASGIDAVGIDLNPVALLAASAKTSRLSVDQIDAVAQLASRIERLSTYVASEPALLTESSLLERAPNFRNRDMWFSKHVVGELSLVLEEVRRENDLRVRTLGLCAFSAVLVRVSNQESETRWCAKQRAVAAGETARKIAAKLSTYKASLLSLDGSSSCEVIRADARAIPLPSDTFKLVVTSPPYANSHDYYLYNKLRLYWLGEDVQLVQRNEIGSRNRHSDKKEPIDTYVEAMSQCLTETSRLLVVGGHAAYVVADAVVRGEFFDMGEIFSSLGVRADLGLVEHLKFSHKALNSLFPSNFGTNEIKQTHVLVFEK